jgi:hypothetical protein
MWAEIKAGQDEMKDGLEEMKATVRASRENMETAVNSIQSELEETIKNRGRCPGICQPTDPDLCKELNIKIEETQLDLQVVSTFHDTLTKNHCEEIGDTKKDFHLELNFKIQGTRVKIETTWHVSRMQLAEVKA